MRLFPALAWFSVSVGAHAADESEHGQTHFWLTAIAQGKLAGKADHSRLPGWMVVERAPVYSLEPAK